MRAWWRGHVTDLSDQGFVRVLAVAIVFGQRFAVPGTPIPLLLPIVLAWVWFGVRRGLLQVSRRRLTLMVLFVAASALAIPLQNVFVHQPLISILSWGLVLATWAPFVLVFARPTAGGYRETLTTWVNVNLVAAGLCIAMMGSQLVGLRYTDILENVVPSPLLIPGYNTTYPLYFGSEIYRANGWVGLEASIMSFALGTAVLAALIARLPWWKTAVLVVAMLCTSAGSGYLIVAVGVAVLLISRLRGTVTRFVAVIVPLLGLLLLTPFGADVFGRATEASSSTSSTSLRAIQAYVELGPRWINDPAVFLLGKGAGSSQQLIAGTGQDGLQSSTPVKIFFEYGLIVGVLFMAFIVSCYRRGPNPAIAFTMFFSLFTVQPGVTVIALLAQVYFLVGVWEHDPPVRDEVSPPATELVGARGG